MIEAVGTATEGAADGPGCACLSVYFISMRKADRDETDLYYRNAGVC